MIIEEMFFYFLGKNVNIKSVVSGTELFTPPKGDPVPAGNRGANVCSDAALLIGDAASSNNPLTGGGI